MAFTAIQLEAMEVLAMVLQEVALQEEVQMHRAHPLQDQIAGVQMEIRALAQVLQLQTVKLEESADLRFLVPL